MELVLHAPLWLHHSHAPDYTHCLYKTAAKLPLTDPVTGRLINAGFWISGRGTLELGHMQNLNSEKHKLQSTLPSPKAKNTPHAPILIARHHCKERYACSITHHQQTQVVLVHPNIHSRPAYTVSYSGNTHTFNILKLVEGCHYTRACLYHSVEQATHSFCLTKKY